jgi:hypothetical protein
MSDDFDKLIEYLETDGASTNRISLDNPDEETVDNSSALEGLKRFLKYFGVIENLRSISGINVNFDNLDVDTYEKWLLALGKSLDRRVKIDFDGSYLKFSASLLTDIDSDASVDFEDEHSYDPISALLYFSDSRFIGSLADYAKTLHGTSDDNLYHFIDDITDSILVLFGLCSR